MSTALFSAIWVVTVLIPLGVGTLLVPVVVKALRLLAGWKRHMVYQWSGIRVEPPHSLLPPAGPGFRGWFDETVWLLKDLGT